MTKQTETNLNVAEMSGDDLIERFGTKSAVIRYLDSEGWKRGDIARKLGIRYQHVRNVLITPLKKS